MVDGHVGELAITGDGGTGVWASFPRPAHGVDAGVGHWHGSARVIGIDGFSGASDVADLWVEGLQEFVTALRGLLDEQDTEADLDLEMAQVSVVRRTGGVLRVEVDLEDPMSDSTVSCKFDTTPDALRETLDQAIALLAQVSA